MILLLCLAVVPTLIALALAAIVVVWLTRGMAQPRSWSRVGVCRCDSGATPGGHLAGLADRPLWDDVVTQARRETGESRLVCLCCHVSSGEKERWASC